MHAVGKFAAVLITTLTLVGSMTLRASAAAPNDFVDDPPAELVGADFCTGVVTFPVLADHYSSGTEHVIRHGDGPLHFDVHFRDVDTFTNTLNDQTFTIVNVGHGKDLQIVAEGDLLTITFAVQFMQFVYAPDGSLVYRTAGTFRTQETIDTNGTLTDTSDDETVEGSFSVVKDFVGYDETSGHDFCEDLVTYIG
jgi:hypothetical protein